MDKWILPDRREFSSFVNKTIWKKGVEGKESLLLPHQRFVALYLDPLSPYRGLLLYHGLGTGKTCASIAVAQSFLEANKRVVVLAPASLRKNFEQEVIKCGGNEFTS
jgi:Rad3-related DNA helicase